MVGQFIQVFAIGWKMLGQDGTAPLYGADKTVQPRAFAKMRRQLGDQVVPHLR